jgi:hypothetical protein
MPIESYTRTVNDVFEYVKVQFGDEAGIQLGISNVLKWINVAQREIVQTNTTINEFRAKTDIIAGQAEYPVVSDPAFANVQNIHTVFYNGAPLQNLSFNEAVDYIITGKENATTGVPSIWYIKAGVINLWPSPSAAITQGLTIYANKAPTLVTGTGDLLSVPDNYYSAVLQNVMAQAYEMDENFQAAGIKAQQFEKSVGQQANQGQIQQAQFHTIQVDPEDYW